MRPDIDLRSFLDTRGAAILLILSLIAVVGFAALGGLIQPALMPEGTSDVSFTVFFLTLPLSLIIPVITVLMTAGEWSDQSIQNTLLQRPGRLSVLTSKVLATTVVFLVLVAFSFGLAAATTWIGGELMGEGAVFSTFDEVLTSHLPLLVATLLFSLAMGIVLQSTVLGLVAAIGAPFVITTAGVIAMALGSESGLRHRPGPGPADRRHDPGRRGRHRLRSAAAAAPGDRADCGRHPPLGGARGGVNAQESGSGRGLGWPGSRPRCPLLLPPHGHQELRMTPAVLPSRPLSRIAAAAAAAVLLLGGCTSSGTEPDGEGATDGAPTASAPEEQGPQLEELGTSAAVDLPSDPAEDPAYSSYYEQDIEWGPCEGVDGPDGSNAAPSPSPWPGTTRMAETIDIAVAQLPGLRAGRPTLWSPTPAVPASPG